MALFNLTIFDFDPLLKLDSVLAAQIHVRVGAVGQVPHKVAFSMSSHSSGAGSEAVLWWDAHVGLKRAQGYVILSVGGSIILSTTCHVNTRTHSLGNRCVMSAMIPDAALNKRPKRLISGDTIGAEKVETATQVPLGAFVSLPCHREGRDSSLIFSYATWVHAMVFVQRNKTKYTVDEKKYQIESEIGGHVKQYHTGHLKGAWGDLLYAHHQGGALKDLRWLRQKGVPFPFATRHSYYPTLQQQCLDQVQETAVDEMGQKMGEATAMNEILTKKKYDLSGGDSNGTSKIFKVWWGGGGGVEAIEAGVVDAKAPWVERRVEVFVRTCTREAATGPCEVAEVRRFSTRWHIRRDRYGRGRCIWTGKGSKVQRSAARKGGGGRVIMNMTREVVNWIREWPKQDVIPITGGGRVLSCWGRIGTLMKGDVYTSTHLRKRQERAHATLLLVENTLKDKACMNSGEAQTAEFTGCISLGEPESELVPLRVPYVQSTR
ncbi:hypothetical protein H4582DRAFT_2060216 [Lactarius indigo]|nr:hypothetical protein H4582DRAFT_2060216 [Lactarius indigo]